MSWIEVGKQEPPKRPDLLLWVDNAPRVGHWEGDRFYADCTETLRGFTRVRPSHWMLIEKPEEKGK